MREVDHPSGSESLEESGNYFKCLGEINPDIPPHGSEFISPNQIASSFGRTDLPGLGDLTGLHFLLRLHSPCPPSPSEENFFMYFYGELLMSADFQLLVNCSQLYFELYSFYRTPTV